MKFRPRYSLLTLLVLTALVAGGVKWWHGPHHVVERSVTRSEVEYTYTRDWQGNIIIHGPHIERCHNSEALLECVMVHYYIKGVRTDHEQEIMVSSDLATIGFSSGKDKPLALPPADEAAFQAAIQQEMDQIEKRGLVPSLMEYHYYDFKHGSGDVEVLESLD